MITKEFIRRLIEYPHYLGWLIGKEKLLPIHSEWIRYCWDSSEPRALQAFRGGYKSTAIDVVGIIRNFLVRPDDRIAIIRKSYKDACTIVDSVSKAMKLPALKEVFKFVYGFEPKATTDKEGKINFNFKKSITPEASLTAFGLDSSLTGFHFDRIICDDIITLKDRISKAEREKTKEIVKELATNIIDPSKGSIWIGTPWHDSDAWKTINTFCPIAKYPIEEFNFLGAEAVEQKRRTTSPFLFSANYSLEINKDESLLFSEPRWAEGWDYTNRLVSAHLDAGFDGSDFCALSILSPIDDKDFRGKGDFQGVGFCYAGHVKTWMSEIVDYYRRYKCREIYIEDNADKGYVASELKRRGLRVKTYHESENKAIKIETQLYGYWSRILWSPNTDDEYMSQILDFRPDGTTHDDAPDSMASLIRAVCAPHLASKKILYQW